MRNSQVILAVFFALLRFAEKRERFFVFLIYTFTKSDHILV